MKKYLVALGVAVLGFASAAFAATLNLDGGVIQSGKDDDLTCVEDAVVESYVIDKGASIGVRFAPNTFDGCVDGSQLHVYAYNGDDAIARSTANDPSDGDSGKGTSVRWDGFESGPDVDPADIESVQVVVEGPSA